MPLSVGEALANAGLMLLEEAIGTGGSAVVHKCRVLEPTEGLPRVGMHVAVKEYKPDILTAPGAISRIRQEADIGRLMEHPNVVRTYGLLGDDDNDGPLLLLLEWIEGAGLDDWLEAQTKTISWETRRGIALGLVDAVGALHHAGVFHRDIKPENVKVRADGTPVLMDVGVSELTGNDDHTLHTMVRDFVGSVRFAAPQFLRGEPFTAAEDVYSLAATLFLLFTGRQVYANVERKPLIPYTVLTTPARVESLQDGVPVPMRMLLDGALNHDRTRRPTLEELRDSLKNPDAARYITKELEAQATEVRSYPVLSVTQDGLSLFADLRGNRPEVDEVYTVVRQQSDSILVPSLNREVTPEIWVADAVLKHVHQGLGYFAIRRRRWVPNNSSTNVILELSSRGRWVDEEGSKLKVSVGDLVVRVADQTGVVI